MYQQKPKKKGHGDYFLVFLKFSSLFLCISPRLYPYVLPFLGITIRPIAESRFERRKLIKLRLGGLPNSNVYNTDHHASGILAIFRLVAAVRQTV